MKKLLAILILPTFLCGQIPLNERMVKTCQVWGFLKYFHDGPSKCLVNWDSVLLANIPAMKSATNTVLFNAMIQNMVGAAGTMQMPTSPKPAIPPGYNTNLDTSWIHHAIFSTAVRSQLDTVMSRFRPHNICNVTPSGFGIRFLDDSTNNFANKLYPNNAERILVAFRYWNYIEYFFNSKYLMTTRWDSTLLKVIPHIDTASHSVSYGLGILRLIAGIDDTHGAGTNSQHLFNTYFQGGSMPPFLCDYIQNQAVVTHVLSAAKPAIQVGDVITKINNIPIDTLFQRRKPYIAWSNLNSLHRDLLRGGKNIFMGSLNSAVVVEAQNASGTYTTSLFRANTLFEIRDSAKYKGLAYFNIQKTNCEVGYVNMGLLTSNDLTPMYQSMQQLQAIIFDIRNYPNGTAWQLTSLLTHTFFTYALLVNPDITFPGITKNIITSTNLPSGNPYNGNIYVLVNHHTQSQAEYSTMMLQGLGSHVKVIGSQTAGADGNVSYVYLPGGFVSYFSTLRVAYPNNTNTQRVGVLIDYTVTPTVTGIRNGTDEVLDFALATEGCNLVSHPEMAQRMPFRIFPNPVQNKLSLEVPLPGTKEIVLLSITGQTLKTIRTENEAEIMETQDLSDGVYFIQIKYQDQTNTFKFIKN